MSNVLNVSSSIPGYDNNIKNNPFTTVKPDLRSYPDAFRVGASGEKGFEEESGAGSSLAFDSNYGSFMQILRESPQLTKVFSQLLFGGLAGLVEAGSGEAFAAETARFMECLNLNVEDAPNFLKSQADGSIRYKGAFFNLLRQVMNETASIELKSGILDFIRRYGDLSAGRHILKNIESNLNDAQKNMFSPDREELDSMSSRLKFTSGPQATAENAGILKNEILPFLSRYIGKTHDMGRVRDAITLLAYNTARYENGEPQGLAASFRKLMNYQVFARRFEGLDADALMEKMEGLDFEKEGGKSEYMRSFLNILQLGIQGEAGLENRQVFEDILQSLLLNESVYLPLVHLMIPMELEGQPVFSEIWIDPDSEDTGNVLARDRIIRLLVKFDIKEVGYFDLMMICQDGKADVQLFYPEKLKSSRKMIEFGLGGILARNGIESRSLLLDVSQNPLQLHEVFPKLLERRNSVNVRV